MDEVYVFFNGNEEFAWECEIKENKTEYLNKYDGKEFKYQKFKIYCGRENQKILHDYYNSLVEFNVITDFKIEESFLP